MTNHYYLLVETPDGNLSKGMRHFNGVHTQAPNRCHTRTGHLFQGHFNGIIIDRALLAGANLLRCIEPRLCQHSQAAEELAMEQSSRHDWEDACLRLAVGRAI
jgi:hypothetical protein